MSLILRSFIAVLCIVLFMYVVHLVAKEKLQLRYSLLWLILVLILLLAVVFPSVIFYLAALSGFETSSNFVFFIGLFFLLAISMSLTVIVSMQTVKIKNLTQRIALMEFDSKRKNTVRRGI